jgi:hypothetical protein
MGRAWVALVLSCTCLCLQPAQATPPERPPAVEGECTQAFPLSIGQAPAEGLVDPATGKVVCGGVLLPTSLVAYYIELDSWKDVAVVKLEEPTAWEIWSERLQWVAIGASAAILTYAAVSD